MNPRAAQRGFSLVEIMIALTLGLLLLAAVLSVMLDVTRANRELARIGRQVDNARYALEVLSDDAQHAGFFGQYDRAGTELPVADPDPCLTTPAALEEAMALAVQGYDAQSAGFARPSCIGEAEYLQGTDILVIRRASTAAVDAAALDAGGIYVQGRYDSVIVATGEDPAAFTLQNTVPPTPEPIAIRPYRVHIYFVSPCSQTGASCDDGLSSLKRLELVAGAGGAQWQRTTIAVGIENLQLYYGVDSAPAGSPDGLPDLIGGDLYVANPGDWNTPAGQTAWSNVVAVQAYLLARNTETTPGYEDTKTYVLSPSGNTGAVSISGSGGYKRRVFSLQSQVSNVIMRRTGA